MFFIKRKKVFSYKAFMKKAKRLDPFELHAYDELAIHLKSNAKQATPKKLGLKLIIISDTHGYLAFGKDRFPAFMQRVPEYDLCILLGDIDTYDLEQILKIVPKDKILAVRGNHDSFELYESFGIKEMSGRACTYRRVTFAGIEGSFRYKNKEFPSFTQYESLHLFENLKAADVLISHDCAFEKSKNDAAHAGLAGITRYICQYAPVWHIHGHIHQSYEKSYSNGTFEKCVYLCEYIEI